jgi:malto-oligosyltrehalose trehalohydrolase
VTARFAHPLPFGAEFADGRTRFRIWAPGVDRLALDLDGATLPMERKEGGWFEQETERALAGSPYRYRLPDGALCPDPAARAQQGDVDGPSLVVDPRAYEWRAADWRGRPWEETVLYELHAGAFGEGGFDGLRRRLDHFVDLGVTAVELMPIADFPGRRGWGYDGVLPFAPEASYGRPDQLKALIDEAHQRGLMIFLDVVYNHFGPEGNWLPRLAPPLFTDRHQTPWGAAIDYARPEVREFFVQNALFWIQEYRFDGLRFDAVHAIVDDGEHILTEIARRVREACAGRHVHLVLENDANEASRLAPRELYDGQWNDDFHHVAHVLLTGEQDGYYQDFAERPVARFARALAEGFVYQGDVSRFRGGAPRGEPSAGLPPACFVNFLQNHDQVGNRAFGERLTTLAPAEALRVMVAIQLLAPGVPLIFMGEEWGAREPFLYFTDFAGELAEAVRQGRRREFARFARFGDDIPDPNAAETFERSRIAPPGPGSCRFYAELLRLRRTAIAPRLMGAGGGLVRSVDGRALSVAWTLGDGARLTLCANLGDDPGAVAPPNAGRSLYESASGTAESALRGEMPGWSAAWYLALAGAST